MHNLAHRYCNSSGSAADVAPEEIWVRIIENTPNVSRERLDYSLISRRVCRAVTIVLTGLSRSSATESAKLAWLLHEHNATERLCWLLTADKLLMTFSNAYTPSLLSIINRYQQSRMPGVRPRQISIIVETDPESDVDSSSDLDSDADTSPDSTPDAAIASYSAELARYQENLQNAVCHQEFISNPFQWIATDHLTRIEVVYDATQTADQPYPRIDPSDIGTFILSCAATLQWLSLDCSACDWPSKDNLGAVSFPSLTDVSLHFDSREQDDSRPYPIKHAFVQSILSHAPRLDDLAITSSNPDRIRTLLTACAVDCPRKLLLNNLSVLPCLWPDADIAELFQQPMGLEDVNFCNHVLSVRALGKWDSVQALCYSGGTAPPFSDLVNALETGEWLPSLKTLSIRAEYRYSESERKILARLCTGRKIWSNFRNQILDSDDSHDNEEDFGSKPHSSVNSNDDAHQNEEAGSGSSEGAGSENDADEDGEAHTEGGSAA